MHEASSRAHHTAAPRARGAPARGPLPGRVRELSPLTFPPRQSSPRQLSASHPASRPPTEHVRVFTFLTVSGDEDLVAVLHEVPQGALWAQILGGLVLGVLLGWLARRQDISWLVTTLEKVGDTFIGLLKLAVAPLVFFAILVSITNLRKVNNAARLATRTLLWFMITSLIAVAIGLVIGLVTNPGSGTGLTPADGAKPEHTGSWIDFLTGIVPTDVITPFTELNVLQIVFMAAVAGIAALQLGEKAQPILNLSESVLELLQKALWWVIRLAPLGTVGLIGKAIATYGWDLIGKYATFTADIYVGCALVMFVVYPTLLATVAKASPLQFFKGAWPAIQLAFVSRSWSAPCR
ncbi:C4-dicarboxylate transport protein [Streptomyces violaceorubidus]